jgi:hypothetical protein
MHISDDGREALREEYDRDLVAEIDKPVTGDIEVPLATGRGLESPAPPPMGEDPARDEHGFLHDTSRPLTEDEKEVAEHDQGVRPRVYAPASARVPKDPAPGDDKLIHGQVGGEQLPEP